MDRQLQECVQQYDVSLRIETPVRDRFFFVTPMTRKLFKYGGIDSDTKGQEWQTYQWDATLTVEQLEQVLSEYSFEEMQTNTNQFTFPEGDRLVECLDFTGGGYPSPFLHEITLYANPVLEGLQSDVLNRIAPLYQ